MIRLKLENLSNSTYLPNTGINLYSIYQCTACKLFQKGKAQPKLLEHLSSSFPLLPPCLSVSPSLLPLSGCDWQVSYIHAISPSARSYSLLEPSSAAQINLPCQREGALRGPISRWLGRGWEGWGVTAMRPSQAWLVSISSQPQGQLGAEPQWALINASHSEAWTVTMCVHEHAQTHTWMDG